MTDLLPLRDYQAACIAALEDKWLQGYQRLAAVLPTGCHRAGQGILMHDGSICTAEDVRIGDQLMGPDGTPRTVLQLARGTGPMMEVVPRKGAPWVINDQHILTLVETQEKSHGTFPSQRGGSVRDVELPVWHAWSASRKHRHKLFRVGVDFPERANPELDPYFLGIILGDGSLSIDGRVSVANVDPEVVETLHRVADDFGLKIRRDGIKGIQYHFSGIRKKTNPIVAILRTLGILPIACADRFIPDDYKLGSRKVRLQALAGLIDSDGSRSRGGYDFGSKSERLATDVAFVARSLGLAAYVSKRSGGVADGHYRVSISGDCSSIPVRVARKVCPPRTQKKDVLRTGFQIRPTGTVEPFYGFQLDGDRRYLLDDFTVTHNSGKTVIFAHLTRDQLQRLPGARVLVLAHTDELVNQAAQRIRDVAPHLRVGVVKAGRDEVHANVIVASVQTLRSATRRGRITNVSLLIVDECHHSTAKTYRDVLEHFCAQAGENGIRVAGFTATFARGDKAKLSEIWEDVAYRRDIVTMIKEGYLLNVRGKRVEVPDLDLSGVRKARGDFHEGDLGEAIQCSMAPEIVAKSYIEHASDRSGIVFTPTVATAYLMAEHLNAAGIATDVVHGGLATRDRRAIIARLESGDLRVVANCQALTEGFDSPIVSTVVIARPTRSAPLYQQMVGRGLRLYPGQTEALLLDVVGASKAHDLRSLVDLSSAPTFTDCPDCTLLDLEEIAERGESARLIHYGDVDTVEFDPLARASRRTWLRTQGGTYFLSAGSDAYVFLSPSAALIGGWDVAWCSKGRAKRDGGFSEHIGVGMEYALLWGEELASQMGGELMDTYTSKGAPWRRKRATDKQLGLAMSLGLTINSDIRAGELSKLIDTHLASQRIDPVVTAIIKTRSSK